MTSRKRSTRNRASRRTLLLGYTRRFPPRYASVELEPLVAALEPWLRALETGTQMPPEPPRIVTVAEGAE